MIDHTRQHVRDHVRTVIERDTNHTIDALVDENLLRETPVKLTLAFKVNALENKLENLGFRIECDEEYGINTSASGTQSAFYAVDAYAVTELGTRIKMVSFISNDLARVTGERWHSASLREYCGP